MKFIEKLLGLSIVMILLFNITMVLMVPRGRAQSTNIYVDPSQVTGVLPGNSFMVNITVSNAPSTYAWNIYLSWDPGLLELNQTWDTYQDPPIWVDVLEGDFLDRREWTPWGWQKTYPTSFLSESLDEANLKGEIMISCSLIGAVPWASGNGWLCSLNFNVKAQGSTLLNLFDTRLADHLEGGYPAYSSHPNNDGFFRNAPTPIHDIRITDVTVLNSSVNRGEVAGINVTVLNEGTVTETFDIYVYADIDTTTIGDEITVATTSHSLNGAGNSEDRSFTYEVAWNTAGCSKAIYTISARVPPVPGEVDNVDNTRIDGTVTIKKILGDVNGDDIVDVNDLILLDEAYGSRYGDSNYNGNCDFDVNGKVDIYDLLTLGKAYT